MRNRNRGYGVVPNSATSIPLVDPHTVGANQSLGELIHEASVQVSTLVRAEVELARAEVTKDLKKGLTGSGFFIGALVTLFYSTFFFFFFIAAVLEQWMWKWLADLIVFLLMVVVTAALGLLGYWRVRRIRGPRQTIASVKKTKDTLAASVAAGAGADRAAIAQPTIHAGIERHPDNHPESAQYPAERHPTAQYSVQYQTEHHPTAAEEPTVRYQTVSYDYEPVHYEPVIRYASDPNTTEPPG